MPVRLEMKVTSVRGCGDAIRSGRPADHAIQEDRLRAAGHRLLADLLDLEEAAHEAIGVFGDGDFAGLRARASLARDRAGDAAHRRVARQAGGIAGDDFACVHADADRRRTPGQAPQRSPPLLRQATEISRSAQPLA